MRHVKLFALGLAFTLVGCQLPLNLPHATAPSGQNPDGKTPNVNPADQQTPQMGTLRFAIRWPERDLPGFSAQVIPISTEKLKFKLENPSIDGFEPITQEFIRKPGEELVTTTLHLPHGGGYKATVTAYDKDGVPIADNTATNIDTQITVTWGKVTPIPITLDALFAPKITDLGVGHGTPGQTLLIAGENLARGLGAPVVIFPSGVEAPGSLQDGAIQTTIPTGAGSGQLKVKVDGVISTSMAIFREVLSLELSAVGAEEGGMRDGDGAIASWLGDFFPITVVGKDATGSVTNPALTGWSNPADGVGAISPNGVFTSQMLGRSSITAKLGSVSGSREVIVAPPAGPIISPGREPNKPEIDASGIVDLDLVQVGPNWLAAWYEPIARQVQWRMVYPGDNDTWTFGKLESTGAAWDGFERAFAVSAAPGANGRVQEICLAYRVLIGGQNSIVVKALHPDTGAAKGNYTHLALGGSNRLLDTAANGSSHAIGILNFAANKYNHQIVKVSFDALGDTGNTLPVRPYDNSEFLPYSYREDSMSITASGSHFVVARHFGTSGGSGPTALHLEHLNDGLGLVRQIAPLHEFNRMPAVASSGNAVLVAAMELQASGTILKLYRYNVVDGEFKSAGLGSKIADLNITGTDPLNWPLDLDWDGTDFILTYGRKHEVVVNGKIVSYPQAMVRKISITGASTWTIGDAYPLAKESLMATLAPNAEGGMALWLDSARRPIMRKVKYR